MSSEWTARFRRAFERFGAARATGLCANGPAFAFSASAPDMPRFPRVPSPEPLPGPEQIEQNNMVRFRCICGRVLKVKWELAGKTGRCPGCHKMIRIPQA